MELIRSTTEMEPSLEPRSEAIPPEAGPQESISGLEPAIQRLTMEVTEAAESTSEKEEEQELLRLRNKLLWLHLSSYTIFLFARFDWALFPSALFKCSGGAGEARLALISKASALPF